MLSDKTSSAIAGVLKATVKPTVRVKHLFRILTNSPELWIEAYAKIQSNKGALTKGVTEQTIDGMSIERIKNLIEKLKDDSYRPHPVRRVYIPKSNGKRRPLGIPDADDKLVQEMVRSLLELVYEPIFSNDSHGFRPQRSCHTALTDVKEVWTGIKWVVDMDISGFYDNIDHGRLVEILEKKIDDKKFIRLVSYFLKAGYLEDWKFHSTFSGTPQGGICSPILANIYLHELDEFMREKEVEFNRGEKRKYSLEYARLKQTSRMLKAEYHRRRKNGEHPMCDLEKIREKFKALDARLKKIPSVDPNDPNYRRLRYTRYADDFLIGIVGPASDAKEISEIVKRFLKERLLLDISEEKSGIRRAGDGFNYLGYHLSINVNSAVYKRVRGKRAADGRRSYGVSRTVTAKLSLRVPQSRVWEFCKEREYLHGGDYPIRRAKLLHLSDVEIVDKYNAEMRGFANYYSLAPKSDLQILEWAGRTSLFRTLATKHRCSASQIKSKMRIGDDHFLRYQVGEQKKFMKVFRLRHIDRTLSSGSASDRKPLTVPNNKISELSRRLSANACEYCGTSGSQSSYEVHHVKKLRDLKKKPQLLAWEKQMIARNRKTIILCVECHDLLHKGRLQSWKQERKV